MDARPRINAVANIVSHRSDLRHSSFTLFCFCSLSLPFCILTASLSPPLSLLPPYPTLPLLPSFSALLPPFPPFSFFCHPLFSSPLSTPPFLLPLSPSPLLSFTLSPLPSPLRQWEEGMSLRTHTQTLTSVFWTSETSMS